MSMNGAKYSGYPLITTSGVSSIMRRIRFQQIFRYLHLADMPTKYLLINLDMTNYTKYAAYLTYWADNSSPTTHQQSTLQLMKLWSHLKVGLASSNIWKTSLLSGASRLSPWVMQQMVMYTDYKYTLEKTLNPAVLMLVCLPEFALNWCLGYPKDWSCSPTIITLAPPVQSSVRKRVQLLWNCSNP